MNKRTDAKTKQRVCVAGWFSAPLTKEDLIVAETNRLHYCFTYTHSFKHAGSIKLSSYLTHRMEQIWKAIGVDHHEFFERVTYIHGHDNYVLKSMKRHWRRVLESTGHDPCFLSVRLRETPLHVRPHFHSRIMLSILWGAKKQSEEKMEEEVVSPQSGVWNIGAVSVMDKDDRAVNDESLTSGVTGLALGMERGDLPAEWNHALCGSNVLYWRVPVSPSLRELFSEPDLEQPQEQQEQQQEKPFQEQRKLLRVH